MHAVILCCAGRYITLTCWRGMQVVCSQSTSNHIGTAVLHVVTVLPMTRILSNDYIYCRNINLFCETMLFILLAVPSFWVWSHVQTFPEVYHGIRELIFYNTANSLPPTPAFRILSICQWKKHRLLKWAQVVSLTNYL